MFKDECASQGVTYGKEDELLAARLIMAFKHKGDMKKGQMVTLDVFIGVNLFFHKESTYASLDESAGSHFEGFAIDATEHGTRGLYNDGEKKA